MSFREKHLWVAIVATLVVWGAYFWRLGERIVAGGLRDESFAGDMGGLFVLGLFAIVVVEGVLMLIATLTTPKIDREAQDERELLASLKASHVSLMILIALIATLAGAAYLFGAMGSAAAGQLLDGVLEGTPWVLLANALMACIVVSELIRFGFNVALLRRGR